MVAAKKVAQDQQTSFDATAFMKEKFVPRTAQIKVDVLQKYFGANDPFWVVRGQTANEVALGYEITKKRQNLEAVVKAIGNNADAVEKIKSAIGVSDETPDDIMKRLEQLKTCSIDPVIDLPVAVRLAETFPVEFYLITNKIIELTGLGMDIKK